MDKTDSSSTPITTPGKQKSNIWMWILVIVFALLITGVLVYYFVFDKSAGTKPTGTKPTGTKSAGTKSAGTTQSGKTDSTDITYKWKKPPWPTDCPESGRVNRTVTCYEYKNNKEVGKVDDSKCPELPPSETSKECEHTQFTCVSSSDGADYSCQKCNNASYTGTGNPCASGFACDTDTTQQRCVRQCGNLVAKNTSSYVCDTCSSENSCAPGFICSASSDLTHKQTKTGNNFCYKKDIDTDTYILEDKICWPSTGYWAQSAQQPTIDSQGNLKGIWACQCWSDENYDSQTGCSPMLQHTERLRDELFNSKVIPYNASELDADIMDSVSKQLTPTAKLMNQFFISENSQGGAGTRGEPVTMPCSKSKDWEKMVSSIKSNPDILTTLNSGTQVDANLVTVDNLEKQWCLLDPATEIDPVTKETYNPLLMTSTTNICSNCRYNKGGTCALVGCPSGTTGESVGTCTENGFCSCPLGTSYIDSNTGYTTWDCDSNSKITCGASGVAGQLRKNPDTGIPTGVCDCRPRDKTTGDLIPTEPDKNMGNYGPTCEKQVSAYCKNKGWGNFTVDSDTYHNSSTIMCACPSGVAGTTCQYTDAATCNGHGTVDDNGNCKCHDNYTGGDCGKSCTPQGFVGNTLTTDDTVIGKSHPQPCTTDADCCPGNEMECLKITNTDNMGCYYKSGASQRGPGDPCSNNNDCTMKYKSNSAADVRPLYCQGKGTTNAGDGDVTYDTPQCVVTPVNTRSNVYADYYVERCSTTIDHENNGCPHWSGCITDADDDSACYHTCCKQTGDIGGYCWNSYSGCNADGGMTTDDDWCYDKGYSCPLDD